VLASASEPTVRNSPRSTKKIIKSKEIEIMVMMQTLVTAALCLTVGGF
jgi:hypothetical protein